MRFQLIIVFGALIPYSSCGKGANNVETELCLTSERLIGVCVKASNCDAKPKSEELFVLRSHSECTFLKICCPADKIRSGPVKQQALSTPGCGYSNPGGSGYRGKTSKNDYADYAEFPWMVALLKTGGLDWTDEDYLGGGTIIHPSVVMTVAHKVDVLDPSDLKCRAGEYNTHNEEEVYDHQERQVKKIIVHEEYFRVHTYNDIALLILKEPFDIAPHINVACLSLTLPAPGTACCSMGWGQDLNKGYRYANILKKLTLPLVSADECQRRYRNTRFGSRYTLHRSLTCAGGEAGVDTCVGDGGSSLVCPIGDPNELRYAVVGMVAYGLACGTENLPGVYAKVPEFYDWVGRQITMEGFNQSSYIYNHY